MPGTVSLVTLLSSTHLYTAFTWVATAAPDLPDRALKVISEQASEPPMGDAPLN